MEKIIKLSVEDDKVIVSEDILSSLKQLFSGCRVNFLLGAGFSAKLLGLLNNNELIFEAVNKFQPTNEDERSKATILSAFLYWSFFKRCIAPIPKKVCVYSTDFKPYLALGTVLYRVFSERGNPALDRQFNIFTTNYDPIVELMFDRSNCVCNDGFEGRIAPRFSTDNYSKSYYRQAMFSNRKSEIPSVNLIKIHGSVTWSEDIIEGGIEYQDFRSCISSFQEKYEPLFDDAMLSKIDTYFTASTPADASTQVSSLIVDTLLDTLIPQKGEYSGFIDAYKYSFLIVNPTKEKFSDTLLNKNYYELLRLFSNELEKENSLLVVNGFSFRDEHILDLVKRSMINPSLKVLIFAFKEGNIADYQKLLGEPKNSNITYVCLDGVDLSLEYFNQILSNIHI